MAWNAFRGFGGHAIAVRGADDIRHDRRWFADEVIVDFPSVVPAVERIRHAFVAEEHARTLTAALEITPREASEGATVPLEVPVRCTCHGCGGRGERWAERCSECAGSGMRLLNHQLQVSVPAGVVHGTRFCFTVTPRHDTPTRIELHVLVA